MSEPLLICRLALLHAVLVSAARVLADATSDLEQCELSAPADDAISFEIKNAQHYAMRGVHAVRVQLAKLGVEVA